MIIIIFLDHIYELYTHIIVRNPWPQSDSNWITGGNGYDVRITYIHGVLMLCSGTLLKGVPLLPVVSLEPPLQMGWQDKRWCASMSLRALTTKLEYMLMISLYLDALYYLSANACDLVIIWIILSMQRPFIRPYAYSILILLSTIITSAVFISLLLLL